ncbi:MAG: hypothetical protein AAGA89_07935 [Pseudomonadota bacterium]
MQTRLFLLIRLLALCGAAFFVFSGTAEAACGGNNERTCKIGFKCDKGYAPVGKKCKPCGKKNQPACQAARRGPQCYNYLEKINGVCRARGGNGQKPYSGVGFDCRPGYNVGSNGKCAPCGKKDQVECEKLRKGPQCKSGLDNYRGYCRAWGQENEKPWPKSRAGYPCDKGLVTENGKCVKCGGKNQPMCRATRPGPQCRDYLGEVDGYCRPRGKEGQLPYEGIGFDCAPGFNVADNGRCTACGADGQISCEVMRQGPQCNDGLTKENGICVADETSVLADKVEAAMRGKLGAIASDLVDTINTAMAAEESDTARASFEESRTKYNTTKGARAKGATVRTNTESLPDNNACLGDQFASWSIGFAGEAGIIGGGGGEAGMVFRCADHEAGRKDSKFYAATIENRSAGAGASAGVTVGMWLAEFDDIAGPSHGFTLNLSEAFSTLQALSVSTRTLDKFEDLLEASIEISVSIWYEQNDDGSVGKFAGLSATVSKGVGIGAGGVYSDVTTYQLP